MRKLADAPELSEFERRVQSMYGRGRITLNEHHEILNAVDTLRHLCEHAQAANQDQPVREEEQS